MPDFLKFFLGFIEIAYFSGVILLGILLMRHFKRHICVADELPSSLLLTAIQYTVDALVWPLCWRHIFSLINKPIKYSIIKEVS